MQRPFLISLHTAAHVSNGASGRKTIYERLLAAKRRILAAIHLHFREILSSNRERDLVLKARYLAGAGVPKTAPADRQWQLRWNGKGLS